MLGLVLGLGLFIDTWRLGEGTRGLQTRRIRLRAKVQKQVLSTIKGIGMGMDVFMVMGRVMLIVVGGGMVVGKGTVMDMGVVMSYCKSDASSPSSVFVHTDGVLPADALRGNSKPP